MVVADHDWNVDVDVDVVQQKWLLSWLHNLVPDQKHFLWHDVVVWIETCYLVKYHGVEFSVWVEHEQGVVGTRTRIRVGKTRARTRMTQVAAARRTTTKMKRERMWV